jgi:hypothetical protein
MNKIKNISLLCALLSAGSAVAELGPILSSDGTSFQLNFPQEIVNQLNEFIAGVASHESYEAFSYTPSSNGSLHLEIQKEFWTTIGAMAPYVDISVKTRKARLVNANLVGVAKTLLELHANAASCPIVFNTYINTALNYLLFPAERSMICLPSCMSLASCRKFLYPGDASLPIVEDYICALDEVSLLQGKAK